MTIASAGSDTRHGSAVAVGTDWAKSIVTFDCSQYGSACTPMSWAGRNIEVTAALELVRGTHVARVAPVSPLDASTGPP